MHKLSRPVEPEGYAAAYATFVQACPPAAKERTESQRWENLKNEQQEAYKLVKNALCTNQSGLCAFCECKLTENNREIEHFVPKSRTTKDCDHTLDFTNFTMSCKGRRTRDEDDHCGHLKDNTDPAGCILNPYELPDFPLIKFCVQDNKLLFEPDETACEKAGIPLKLVVSTLNKLGLNCVHLQNLRWTLWDELETEMQEEYLTTLKSAHLTPKNGILKPFYTTRLLTLS